ncbi:hypothetical protein BKA56DRAFT_368850 [Ilyonectria sp. MPI-CAGE-AT-0026]|nr:hypothetical protein BKA56DRAFT_368850 [Ilyonectria sp. MPI-CAGE-AT-0026]
MISSTTLLGGPYPPDSKPQSQSSLLRSTGGRDWTIHEHFIVKWQCDILQVYLPVDSFHASILHDCHSRPTPHLDDAQSAFAWPLVGVGHHLTPIVCRRNSRPPPLAFGLAVTKICKLVQQAYFGSRLGSAGQASSVAMARTSKKNKLRTQRHAEASEHCAHGPGIKPFWSILVMARSGPMFSGGWEEKRGLLVGFAWPRDMPCSRRGGGDVESIGPLAPLPRVLAEETIVDENSIREFSGLRILH